MKDELSSTTKLDAKTNYYLLAEQKMPHPEDFKDQEEQNSYRTFSKKRERKEKKFK